MSEFWRKSIRDEVISRLPDAERLMFSQPPTEPDKQRGFVRLKDRVEVEVDRIMKQRDGGPKFGSDRPTSRPYHK